MKKIFKHFSLIISIYDKTDPYLLTKSLHSILNQYYLPKEILIMLDGPVNVRLRFIVNSFSHNNRKKLNIKIFQNKKNLGIAISYNKLIKNSSNEIVAIQDSDDVSNYMRFYYQFLLINTNKKYSIIGSNVYENYITEKKKIKKEMPSSYKLIKRRCKFSNPINHPTVMLKKKVLTKYCYKNFLRMEDYYLWIKMMSNNVIFFNINKCLVTMSIDKNFFSRRTKFQILVNECIIQYQLYKYKFNNFFEMIFFIILKNIYHVLPSNVKKYFRKRILFFFSKNKN